jgi:hypothetical protein
MSVGEVIVTIVLLVAVLVFCGLLLFIVENVRSEVKRVQKYLDMSDND